MASLSKLLLNTFAALADLATREPDVEGLHASIDALSSKRNREDSTSTKSPQLHDTSPSKSLSPKRKMTGKDLFSLFSKAKPKAAKADANIPSNHSKDQKSTNNSNDECFFDANENEDDAVQNPDDIFYPNGNNKITLEKGESLGWALKSCGHRKNKDGTIVKYRVCLGALVCPHPNCGFISRPLVSQAKKSANNSSSSGNSSLLLGNKQTKCKIHDCMLEHVPCNARITIREPPTSTCVEIENDGNHDHPKPHRIHVSKRGKKSIQDYLQRKPTANPISMKVGTKGTEPVWTGDSTLVNMGRLRATVRKERKVNHGTADIAAFDRLTNGEFITDSSIACVDGAIIMQTAIMRKILKESEVTSETDTIEGFVRDDILPDANVTVTSSYSSLLQKWVPTQMAILFGKSSEHYARYFKTLLQKGYKYKDFNDFDNEFMGMVCDFSDAERDGFKKAVEATFGLSEEEFDMEKFYTYCTVHFDRSLSRVQRNNAVVSLQFKDEFRSQVAGLREETDKGSFWKKVEKLKSDFPKCKKWIDWYLHEKRGKCFFPSLKDEDFVGGVLNTNAQESTGRTIQLSYDDGKEPNIADVFFHLFRYAKMCDFEYTSAATGTPTDYSRPRIPPKRSRLNDGRAPDTNDSLFGNVKQRQKGSTGRKLGTSNKVPSGNAIIPLDVCIPWSFRCETPDGELLEVNNTCAMDTVLMGLFLLRQHDPRLQLKIKEVRALDSVLDKIQKKRFNDARLEWIAHCRDLFSEHLPEKNIRSKMGANGRSITVWDCSSSPAQQFGGAIKKLFMYKFYEEYMNCSGEGGEPKCGHYDLYTPSDAYACRERKSWSITLYARDLRDIQGYFDQNYNEYVTEVDCGSGTKLVRNESGKYDKCNGRRKYRKIITHEPTMLMLERGIMSWESDEIVPRTRTVHCMRDIQPLLTIDNTIEVKKYVLVYVVLSNIAHFQGIAILYGKYLSYDGMKTQKMKWIKGDTPFDKGYDVHSLWYARVDDDESSSKKESEKEAANADAKIDSKKRPIPQEVKVTSEQPVAKKVRKRKKYPMGISVSQVSNSGKKPMCQYCRQEISREEWHTVKATPGQRVVYKQTAHYHFNCYQHLTGPEQQQLLTLIENGNYMDDNSLQCLRENINND